MGEQIRAATPYTRYMGEQIRAATPYCVVIQYRGRERGYVRCETLERVRFVVKEYRGHPEVKYIYYNVPDLDFIGAYDARDPGKYV
jgi:hypothetical protein